MGKSNYFSTKSVFGQLLSLIKDKTISDAVKKHDSDRYVKKFKSKDHLLSMLFCSFAKCNSLREVSGAMLGLSGKTNAFGLKHIPKRSTLSDANKNRKVEFFEEIYNSLLIEYSSFISDSRIKDVIKKKLKRNWAFSNLVSFCRIHLFNYIQLVNFLEDPEKDWIIDQTSNNQLTLYDALF